jgi:hypothetical protein
MPGRPGFGKGRNRHQGTAAWAPETCKGVPAEPGEDVVGAPTQVIEQMQAFGEPGVECFPLEYGVFLGSPPSR